MATKKLDYEHDRKGFEDALRLADVLRAEGQKKRTVMQACEDIYLMKKKANNSKEVIQTYSPDGKNKLKGAQRLVSASLPHFRVPREKNNQDVEEISSTLEQVAGVMWGQSNHVKGIRLESELALSGLLYGEMIINVICMGDVVDDIQDAASGETDKWEKARWEGRLLQAQTQAALTPYLFEPASPMLYSARYGRFGVSQMFSEVKRQVSDVKEQWGARALKAIGARKDTDEVTECTLLDNTFKYVWLRENNNEPIFADVHGLPMMQTVAVRVGGSTLFENVEDQYDPFLKTMSESGLVDMQNRILTAVNTQLSATLDTLWDFTQGKDGDTLVIDHNVMLGVVSHPPGSSIKPFTRDILSRDVIGALELVRGINSESTIFDQALGAGTGKNDPYGLVSLLSQAGRLPLVDVQKMMGELGARTQEVTFAWWKTQGKASKVQAMYGKDLALKPSDIPATIRFECEVDIHLPQDKLQMANTGAKFLEMGASWEYVASNYAGIENPDQMAKQRWFEEARRAAGMKKIEEIVTRLMTPKAPVAAPGTGDEVPGKVTGESVPGGPTGKPVPGGPPMPQTPRGMPTEADMQGQVPPMPPEMPGGV